MCDTKLITCTAFFMAFSILPGIKTLLLIDTGKKELSSDFFCNFLPRKWYYYLKSDKDGNKWYALTERKCALLKGD